MQWPSRHFLPAAHGLLLTDTVEKGLEVLGEQ